jgi:HAD superfamily hydrolase (TIGR01549 family)
LLVDIDGTLLSSNALHAAAWCEAFRTFGYCVHAEEIMPMIGMGADRIVPALVDGLTADKGTGSAIADERRRTFLSAYVSHAAPTPGSRELLSLLVRAGVHVVIASAADGDERDALLRKALVADIVSLPPPAPTNTKPDPDVIFTALKQTKVDPAQACLLGDTPYDVEAAARAGVAMIAVRCGGWDDAALEGAAAIFDDPADAHANLAAWPHTVPSIPTS